MTHVSQWAAESTPADPAGTTGRAKFHSPRDGVGHFLVLTIQVLENPVSTAISRHKSSKTCQCRASAPTFQNAWSLVGISMGYDGTNEQYHGHLLLYIYIYTYTYTYMYIHILKHINICIYIYMYTYGFGT